MTFTINKRWLRDFRRGFPSLAVVGVAILLSPLFFAANSVAAFDARSVEGLDEQTESGHRHEPIIVRSKPVIERLPVSVIDPVDIVVSRNGSIYVADQKAEIVFRIAGDGLVDTPLREISGLTRICLDQDGLLYVLQRESRNSRVLQVTPTGLSVELAVVPFEATSMARLASGEILLASRMNQQLVMISTDSSHSVLATLPESIIDIAVSSSEQIHVLHGSGQVSYVSLDGSTSYSGRVPADSRRLFSLPEGELAALSNAAGSRSEILLVDRQGEEKSVISEEHKGSTNRPSVAPRIYSTVPAGTQAVAFDELGNMSLVNPELRAVTRVTTTMMVPCPHCGRPTKLILSPNGPAAPRSRSF